MNDIDLEGRVAIVTGGARGIGRASAERMLRSGATVVLWDLDAQALPETARTLSVLGPVDHTVVDVTDPRAVDAAAAVVRERHGRIDILLNNAGVLGKVAPTVEQDDSDWLRTIDILLNGTFWCSRAVLPAMLAQGSGRIVNIASVSGKEGTARMPAYSAAKAGVIGLTKSMGRELGETGVTVNCITPAAITTDLIAGASPEHHALMIRNIPMERYGTPEEVAALVAWMCSAECSFSTGAVFDLSGARSSH